MMEFERENEHAEIIENPEFVCTECGFANFTSGGLINWKKNYAISKSKS